MNPLNGAESRGRRQVFNKQKPIGNKGSPVFKLVAELLLSWVGWNTTQIGRKNEEGLRTLKVVGIVGKN